MNEYFYEPQTMNAGRIERGISTLYYCADRIPAVREWVIQSPQNRSLTLPASVDLISKIPMIEYHDSIGSTNDRVKELLKQAVLPKLPCLIIAKRQTAGRGRGNKAWWSGDGALLMSLGFELSAFSLRRNDLSLISLAVGLAAVETVHHRLPQTNHVELHWPNDVYVNKKKICGILIESPTPQHFIIGIGMNVNNRLTDIPLEFRNEFERRPITSFIEILGETIDISTLIVDLLVQLRYRIGMVVTATADLVRAAESCCAQIGEYLTIRFEHSTLRGRCLGIEPDGSLRLETSDGIQTIQTGIVESNF